MSLFKSYAQQASVSGITVKVEYADVAGGYGGWFLTRVNGSYLSDADDGGSRANGPSFSADLSYEGTADGTSAATPGSNRDRYGHAFVEQVNGRLNHLFGVGHSAKWTATIVYDVTPAVVDDDWGTP